MFVSAHDDGRTHHAMSIEPGRRALRAALSSLPLPSFKLQLDGSVAFANRATQELLELDAPVPVGQPFTELVEPAARSQVAAALAAVAGGQTDNTTLDVRIMTPSGDVIEVELILAVVRANDKTPWCLTALARDESERRRRDEYLHHRASHDHLTDLPNRSLFMDRLAHAQARARRLMSWVAVLFIDLDGFKAVNDLRGHASGDELLLAIADRLRRVIRPADTLARFGGDEYTVLCEDLANPSEAQDIARRVLQAFELPFALTGGLAAITGTIGVKIALGGELEPAALVHEADAAMYAAKQAGKATYRISN